MKHFKFKTDKCRTMASRSCTSHVYTGYICVSLPMDKFRKLNGIMGVCMSVLIGRFIRTLILIPDIIQLK